MNISTKNLEKAQIELTVELSADEQKPYIEKAVKALGQEVKVDGFRPGNVPHHILRQKIGDMAIAEEAARLAINATLDDIIRKEVKNEVVGRPKVEITKLAPENPLEYKVVLALWPEITLGEYKNLNIPLEKAEVSAEELDKALAEVREMRVKEALVERSIQDGDKATLDIQMFLDNVPLDGGQSQGVAVIIGKNYIVPGFDKELLGLKKNQNKEFKLVYPKEHYMQNIAGKLVEFKVTVKDVYERILPELDDDFAKNFGLNNLADLKENISKSLKEQKEKESATKAERAILEKITSKCKISDIAEILIQSECEKMMAELEQTITEQGGKFEDYLASIHKTAAELQLDLLPDAVKRVKTTLIIREIAKQEKITTPIEDVDKQIKELKEYLKNAPNKDKRAQSFQKHVDSPEYWSYISNVLTTRRVIDQLKDWNIAK